MAQTQQAQGGSPMAKKPKAAPKKPKGAPAQGAGGQKAGGVPAPPKAKPLTARQTKGLAKAQAGGREAQYLAKHPGVAQHQQKIGAPAAGAAPAAPPPGAPATGAGGGKATPPPAPGGAPAPDTTPPPAGGAPTVQDILNKQYGSNAAQTFQQNWYGDNPLTTAMNAANRAAQEQLAGVRARYAGSGFGSSGREALAEGQAIADINTAMGQHLADLGTQVRGTDLDRLANMFATAGQQDILGRQLGLEANQMLANLGTGVTGIGAGEQAIPGADLITTLLTNMSQQPTWSQGAMKAPSK